jgi:hypothetical protein
LGVVNKLAQLCEVGAIHRGAGRPAGAVPR